GARKAKRLGLVDEVVPEPILVDVAAEHALKLAKKAAGGKKPKKKLKDVLDASELQDWALKDTPLGRKVVFDQAKKALLKKTRGNYPAQEKILEVEDRPRRGLREGPRGGSAGVR